MNKIICFLLLFLPLTALLAQGSDPLFLRDYARGGSGNDVLMDMLETTDNQDLLVGGHADSPISGEVNQTGFGAEDIWLFKQDFDDNILWRSRFGGGGKDILSKIIELPDGYLLVGSSNSSPSGNKSANHYGGMDVWLIKTDKNGNKLWDRAYGGSEDDFGTVVLNAPGGGYFIGGYSKSTNDGNKNAINHGDFDYWLIKTNPLGIKEWDASYGGDTTDILRDIILEGGELILGGHSLSAPSGNKTLANYGESDFWLLSLTTDGNTVIDEYIFGGSEADELGAMAINIHNDGFYIAGSSASGISGNKSEVNYGQKDFWILRLDGNREIVWQNTIGGAGNDEVTCLSYSADGAPIIGGATNSPGGSPGNIGAVNQGNYDYIAIKIDTLGRIFWQKAYGGSDFDSLTAITVRCDRGLYFGGVSASGITGDRSQANRGGEDYWILSLEVPTIPRFRVQDHCFGTGIVFNDESELHPDEFSWDFDDPLSGRNSSTDRNPNHTFSNPGIYNVTLTIREGCQKDTSLTQTIEVFDHRVRGRVDLGEDFYICRGENNLIENQKSVSDEATFFWNTGDSTERINIQEPGIYVLTITVAQCFERDTVEVAWCPILFIPNAFTPQGDLINDTWGAQGEGIIEFKLGIFNRWGEMLYHTEDFYDWWDGTYKGHPVQQDVYVYKIIYRGITGPELEKVGTVTLYR